MVGNRSWFGGLLNRSTFRRQVIGFSARNFDLTPLQEERLHKLKDRLGIPFDETRPDHQEALKALWEASFPEREQPGLVSEKWKDMGWQGANPSTDFRGCGFISLENLLFFARTYPGSFKRLLHKRDGERAAWEYPFAVAGLNISYMLVQLLELNSEKPKSIHAMNFIRVLSAFEMMDAQWLARRASYMQFNEIMESTKSQLERELSLDDVHRIRDLPAYNLLFK
ncbi:hypothetical protein LUZ61_020650 [Rhynchospora tenuis]|uniref:ELMO domain-containing protein n=1 Tax=Rhynchospora tenuis TaxID=198213 RepID=A0AAD6EP87_9POAL|nr:hypothetical protein LUZ61_020650 [Rhynchospora tenuis]